MADTKKQKRNEVAVRHTEACHKFMHMRVRGNRRLKMIVAVERCYAYLIFAWVAGGRLSSL